MLGPLADQRGVALPLAMIMLVILTALMVSFALLAYTEPTIAGNQLQTAQALRLADSGLQLAMWGLTNTTDPQRVGTMTIGTTAAAPYDGNTFVTLGGTGGFKVQVQWAAGQPSYERTVTAVGWVPVADASHTNSHRKIQAVVQMGLITPLDPPCVLCVGGEVQVNGSAASMNSSANGCGGSNPPQYAVQTVQALQTSGNPSIIGYGTSGTGATNAVTDTSPFKYPATSLAQIKALAQANGTYYRGAVTSLPAGGIVYIDTVDGTDFTNSTPTSNDGSLSISSNGTFNGIVVVAGTVTVHGNYTFNGLIYSLNDLNISGNVTVNGGIVSENRRDTSSTNIDSTVDGNVTLNYNCANIRNGGGSLSTAWVLKSGSYYEASGY